LSKVVFICYKKLCVFSKLWSSQKHECGKHDQEIIESSKGEGNKKEEAYMETGGGSKSVEKKEVKE
jgi:hypothetical protein